MAATPAKRTPARVRAASHPHITGTYTYQVGEKVYFEIFFTDPGHNAAGFGFVGVQGSDWPNQSHSFSSPASGIVEAGTISYPLNQECGTGLEYMSNVDGLDLRHHRHPQQAGGHPPGLHHLTLAQGCARA